MSYFEAKMHHIRFRLTALAQKVDYFQGKGGEEGREGRERDNGRDLLLRQGEERGGLAPKPKMQTSPMQRLPC